MNHTLILLISNLTSIACVISAVFLAYNGIDAWGWFLVVASLSFVYPKSIGG